MTSFLFSIKSMTGDIVEIPLDELSLSFTTVADLKKLYLQSSPSSSIDSLDRLNLYLEKDEKDEEGGNDNNELYPNDKKLSKFTFATKNISLFSFYREHSISPDVFPFLETVNGIWEMSSRSSLWLDRPSYFRMTPNPKKTKFERVVIDATLTNGRKIRLATFHADPYTGSGFEHFDKPFLFKFDPTTNVLYCLYKPISETQYRQRQNRIPYYNKTHIYDIYTQQIQSIFNEKFYMEVCKCEDMFDDDRNRISRIDIRIHSWGNYLTIEEPSREEVSKIDNICQKFVE